jgi:hypothetical protein
VGERVGEMEKPEAKQAGCSIRALGAKLLSEAERVRFLGAAELRDKATVDYGAFYPSLPSAGQLCCGAV